ncbi:MAG: hypothetical protein HZB19_06970 [Chloroflexi bacterium]|nr:hypothetical protein [Chloroflexota bacterium]
MSCGLPLGDLFYLADALLSRPSDAPLPFVGRGVALSLSKGAGGEGSEGLRAQLYQLYGEGQISEEVFTALRTLADRGQLRPADLAVHRARSRGTLSGPGDPVMTNALRGIRSRLTQLGQTRASSERVLNDLESRLAALDDRIIAKEQAARQAAGHDDEAARHRLAEKMELVESRERLATQAVALKADLSRLDDLCAQLETKAAELEAVQARSRLSEEVLK